MFSRSFASKDRASKATKPSKRSFASKQKLFERLDSQQREKSKTSFSGYIITVVVGKDQRLFACHEEVLVNRSPYFAQAVRDLFFEANAKRIDLTDEEPATFSCVLEYLYKNDYTPRLLHDKRRNWYLDIQQDLSPQNGGTDSTMFHSRVGDVILRDTAVYCAAERYGLEELKRLALRKQGLQSGIPVATILRSARFAYDNTPEHDSALRAHYLALIIRSRKTFKKSGTMQQEMENGGKLWWDLFVAMCNHMDDLQSVTNTPRTI